MKPQPYNRRKRFFFELSRIQMILGISGFLFILVWVFILGIIVGRGYVSDTITQAFNVQIQKLQLEKKALLDKYLAQGKKGDIPQDEILKPKLDFYNELSKKEPGNTLMMVPQPTAKPPEGQGKTGSNEKSAPVEAKKETKEPPMESKISTGHQEPQDQSGHFMVQVGSYREEASAQSSIKRLHEKKYPAVLKTKEIPQKGGKWFRVQMGPYKNRAEAENMIKKLEHDGFQAMVLENND